MNKKFFLILFLVTLNSIAQVIDSTSNQIKIISDSTFTMQDSLQLNDSLLAEVKRDSITPIYSTTLSDKSFIITNHDLSHNDYKYTGDFLRLLPFNFIKDIGFSGQQNETFLYGVGNNSISYLMDGVSVNDRYSNSLNLNLIQSEDVDSIEIVPLPRGFLHGAYSNPVSVNFITNDFITKQPYTRIRFYQGANRDMMFDGSFNAKVMNRLIASFNITNRILDETYNATDYSIWQGKFKLKYLLSNDVNIIASYNINDYKAGYSGGVDVDSITASGRVVDEVMYSSLDNPPMFYPNGRLNTLTHLPRLRVLATPTSWLKTDASVYYLYDEYEKNTNRNDLTIKDISESKALGFNIKNDVKWKRFKFQANANYEKGQIHSSEVFVISDNTKSWLSTIDYDFISFSGVAIVDLFDSTLTTSVFGRINSYSTSSLWPLLILTDIFDNKYSIGFDLTYKPVRFAELYFGYSDPYANYDITKCLIETSLKINFDFLSVKLKYFRNPEKILILNFNSFTSAKEYGNVSGFGFNISFEYLKFLFQTNLSVYNSMDNTYLFGVPKFQTQTGLYFKDILFDNNLDLKTGFVFYYIGKNNVFTYENGLVEVPASNKLDFTLVGEVQKTAIIYFTWQNLLGNNYYITPYYPMPGRSIRFGVAWEMFN